MRYQNMLQEFINQLDPEELQNGYSQHDGATAHTAQTSLNFLTEFYDDRINSFHTEHIYPLRPFDYFLFSTLKNRQLVDTIEVLEVTIIQECERVLLEVLL